MQVSWWDPTTVHVPQWDLSHYAHVTMTSSHSAGVIVRSSHCADVTVRSLRLCTCHSDILPQRRWHSEILPLCRYHNEILPLWRCHEILPQCRCYNEIPSRPPIFYWVEHIKIQHTCCRNSLSGTTSSSQVGRPSWRWQKTTRVSLRKFFPSRYSSRPPVAGEDTSDFRHTSGTPGGCAGSKDKVIWYRY